ncbi:murein transglycosylase A [Enterobacteriaceae bacterium ESL0689]|nr:murein transglycosylase A [Enterobacteriaceae bacterium ESL0689]
MKGCWIKPVVSGMLLLLLAACTPKSGHRDQQYDEDSFNQLLSLVNNPNAIGSPINAGDFSEQIRQIHQASPRLYSSQSTLYDALQRWLRAGGDTRTLRQFGIDAWQMQGMDNYGNVQFTGYYTPVVQARYTRQGAFRYPIYRLPPKRGKLPSRARIYAGALSDAYVLAYSNSLMDNFIMDVQGSGYIDFGDGSPLNFFSYAGKNGWPYRSIGKALIDRGEIKKENMSMQAIRQWGERHSEAEVRALLEQNPSFVFFKPQSFAPVKGASAVPLIDRASVASDRSIVSPGTALLAEIPLLDSQGRFTGQYELRLMVALDVGGAIQGHHFDIYQGVGEEAGQRAGWYNHYGRVWLLKDALVGGGMFSN